MKITESKLRSIVKEILSKIQEERVEIDEEYELAEDLFDEMQSGGKRGAKATAPRIRDPRPDEKRKARKDTRKAGKKEAEKQKRELGEEKMPEDVLSIKRAINKKRLKQDAEDAKKAKKGKEG